MQGRIAVGTLVTISMGLIGFFGYFSSYIIGNFQAQAAAQAATNENVAAVMQYDTDNTKRFDELNGKIDNLQSSVVQLINIDKYK